MDAPADDDVVRDTSGEHHCGRGAGVAGAARAVVVARDEALNRVAGRGNDELGVEVGRVACAEDVGRRCDGREAVVDRVIGC